MKTIIERFMEQLNLEKTLAEAAKKSFMASFDSSVLTYNKDVAELKQIEDSAVALIHKCNRSYNEVLSFVGLLSRVGVIDLPQLDEYRPKIQIVDATPQDNSVVDDEQTDNVQVAPASLSTNSLIAKAEFTPKEEVNDDEEHVVEIRNGKASIVKRKRGVQKRVQEIVSEEGSLLTTGEIVERIRQSMGNDTTYSSITNSLIRLFDQRVFNKSKSESGANLYGLIEWFNEDGSVKPEYERREDDNQEATTQQEDFGGGDEQPISQSTNNTTSGYMSGKSTIGLFE